MTEEAREAIRDFYVDLRAKGTDDDAPVPVTARKLEALVRLSEASARVRLSDTVEQADAERVIEIVRSCLQDIGVDPETGEFDADIVEAGTSKSQRDRIKNLKQLIGDIEEEEYDDGAPVDIVLERAEEIGMDHSKAEHEIDKLKQKGEVYEPSTDSLERRNVGGGSISTALFFAQRNDALVFSEVPDGRSNRHGCDVGDLGRSGLGQ